MDKTREDSDASAAKKEKKSKKNKTRTDHLLDVGAGEGDVGINADLPNDKGQKHREKKRKSELNEDGGEDKHDKGNLVNDGDLQKSDKKKKKKKKKRKRDSSENEQGQDDEPAGENNWDPKPGKKKISDGKETEVSVEDCQEDMLEKTDKKRKKRKKDSSEKTQMKENEKGQHDEPIVEADCEPKTGAKKTRDVKGTEISMEGCLENEFEKTVKEKKKRKKDSSEKTQMKENEKGQHDETTVERDCEPKIGEKKTRDGKVSEISTEGCQKDEFEKTEKKMKKQKKKNKTDTEMNVTVSEASTLKTRDNEDSKDSNGKKKTKSVESSEKQRVKVKGSKVNKKTTESVENNNTEKTKAKAKGKSKKVSFVGQVEVFPSSDTEPEKQPTKGDGLVRGKRFTPEEDAIVKQAVLDYVEAHDLGEDGLQMVLRCNSHVGMKKCWQEIGTCIPYRPYTAVYSRAHILFERSENRSWSPEEIELLRESHKKHGNDWKKVADELGKHRFHVKDTWRRIKFENLKLGKWSQEEYQNLFDLVNMDYQMKIDTEKKSKHGMLRDNIPWTAISEKLSTRSDSTCCVKWYNQLTSSLVAEKKWSDADDYRMIGALYELDAACVEDVDWDYLLEHRPGDICKKRWDQMVKHIDHGSKPFPEQVDILAKRYRPDLAETREAWDNKPIVP